MSKSTKPQHIGIIMDGNRRWAEERGLSIFKGHSKGLDVLQDIVRHCRKKGIKALTLFAFSTENWKRPKKEVALLMSLCRKALQQELRELSKNGVRIKIIGEREKLPESVLGPIKEIEELTKNNKEMILNIALSYGGRAEITGAIKNIIRKKISPEDITEKIISDSLWTSELDLLIRTGKEQRISNFLIWQSAYSELYFSGKYWPDFNEKDLDEALLDFSNRRRRRGK